VTSNNERPQLIFKSAYIFFFVTNTFTLKNVELHGADLMKAFDSTIRSAFSSYCDPTLSGTVSVAACIPSSNGWFYMDPIDSLSPTTPNFYKNKAKKSLPNGLFVLQFIRDVTSPVIPQLTLQVLYFKFKKYQNFLYRIV